MIVKNLKLVNENGQEFEIEVFLNGASVKYIEKELKSIDPKYNFYKCLPMIQQGELTLLLIFLGGVIHLKGNKYCVGSDFFDENEINIFAYINELSTALYNAMRDNKPTVAGK